MNMYRFLRLSNLAIAGLALATGAQAAPADLLTRELCKEALPQVAAEFAGVLEPVRREGHCLAGDFTGDGKPDVLMVVRVLAAGAPAGVKTIYPFYDKEAGKGRLQFLALHAKAGNSKAGNSKAGDAQAGTPRYDRLLLDGGSPILVLRHKQMTSDMERVTQRSRVMKELQVPVRQVRGEAVLLGTEAVSAILYWNGKTYVLHEDPGGP